MKILIIGSGGREHTLVWKIAQSAKVKQIYCAPGNAGIAQIAKCISIEAKDINALLAFAREEAIDLTIVGPEDPLANGIVDIFEREGLRIFGPSEKAAQIEASKSFAKKIMLKYGIPTARGKTFTEFDEARSYINQAPTPIVVKADGLAAGKGVMVCKERAGAVEVAKSILKENVFGDAGKKVLIEDFLIGEEASFIAFTDGKHVLPLPTSQDHKLIYETEGDKSRFSEITGIPLDDLPKITPNTGGMGAYSPAPIVTPELHEKIMKEIMIPAVEAMDAEGCPYKGVLYAGLMINEGDVKVVEFNCRFGDPEAQPLLMRTKSDIVPIMEACIDGNLDQFEIEVDDRSAVCVVMASGGYPGHYDKGWAIIGLDEVAEWEDVVVFQAGTTENHGLVVASGGRVLGVTALNNNIMYAIETAYLAVDKIGWRNEYHRDDIGMKALK